MTKVYQILFCLKFTFLQFFLTAVSRIALQLFTETCSIVVYFLT